jgi:hypothetical protein
MKSALQITFYLLFTVFSTGVLVKNCVAICTTENPMGKPAQCQLCFSAVLSTSVVVDTLL